MWVTGIISLGVVFLIKNESCFQPGVKHQCYSKFKYATVGLLLLLITWQQAQFCPYPILPLLLAEVGRDWLHIWFMPIFFSIVMLIDSEVSLKITLHHPRSAFDLCEKWLGPNAMLWGQTFVCLLWLAADWNLICTFVLAFYVPLSQNLSSD